MSPVDPISATSLSPSSPMDISPISAVEANLLMMGRRDIAHNSPVMNVYPSIDELAVEAELPPPQLPATPILSAVGSNLPRLVTSFNRCNGTSSDPVQFTLLTPSPLSLRSPASSSPTTAVLVPEVGRAFGIRVHASPKSPPALRRQNAMEGLADMDVESGKQQQPFSEASISTELPIRLNVEKTPTSATQQRASIATFSRMSHPSRRHLRSPAISMKALSHSRSSPLRSKPRSQLRKNRSRTPITHSATSIVNARNRLRSQKQSHLQALLAHLAHPLVALVSVSSGRSHPDFPRTLLSYHLLTHKQLDNLARHYHQTVDAGEVRWMYPAPIGWGKVWCGSQISPDSPRNATEKRHLVDLETKRRRWGRFIGLKGCESPTEDRTQDGGEQSREDLLERMERQWQKALKQAEEERRLKEKIWGRKF